MKILSILPEFPPGFGGMQTHAVEISDRFHKRGHKIRVLTYQELSAGSTANCDSDLPFHIERCLSRIGFHENVKKVEAQIELFQPDIIYSSTVFYGSVGKPSRTPVICRSPGNDVLRPWIVWPFKTWSQWVSTPWFEKQLYHFFKRLDYPQFLEQFYHRERQKLSSQGALGAAAILANSKYTLAHLKRMGVPQHRIELMPGGVHTEIFNRVDRIEARRELREALSIEHKCHIIMTSCRLVHKKGVDFLIRSVPALTERIGPIHLVIVGDGPKRKKCQRIINQLSLQSQVSIIGSIPQRATPLWLAAADIFILASRLVIDEKTGNCDAETMGRVLCEANAAGTPAIAANSGGIPSVISDGENGLLFQSDDEEGLVICVEKMINDKEMKKRMVDSGVRRCTTEFDWEILADRHEQIFTNFILRSKKDREELGFV